MVVDARWPITKFGVDLNKAWPNSIQTVGDTRVRMPSLVPLPNPTDQEYFSQLTPTIITTASYTVLPSDVFLIIQRVAPATTAIAFPSVLDRTGVPLFLIDASSGVTENIITITPAGGQTVMGKATWPIVSTSTQLASGSFYPVVDLLSWVTAP